MATYIKGVTDYVPQIQPFRPDFNFYQNVLARKQYQYDQGWSKVNTLYNSLLNAPMTRPENIAKRDDFFERAQFEIKRLSGVDLSNPTNIDAAYKLFKPYYSDKDIIHDTHQTKSWQGHYQEGEGLRNELDEEKGAGTFWQGGLDYLNLWKQRFATASSEEALKMSSPGYVRRFDLKKKLSLDAEDVFGSVETQYNANYPGGPPVANGRYKVTAVKGEQLIPSLYNYYDGYYAEDPAAQQYYNVKAELERYSWVQQHKDEFGSEQQAEDQYIATVLNSMIKSQDNMKRDLKADESEVTYLEETLQEDADNHGTDPYIESLLGGLSKQKDHINQTKNTVKKIDIVLNNGQKMNLDAYRGRIDVLSAALLRQQDTHDASVAYAMKDASYEFDYDKKWLIDYEASLKHKYWRRQKEIELAIEQLEVQAFANGSIAGNSIRNSAAPFGTTGTGEATVSRNLKYQRNTIDSYMNGSDALTKAYLSQLFTDAIFYNQEKGNIDNSFAKNFLWDIEKNIWNNKNGETKIQDILFAVQKANGDYEPIINSYLETLDKNQQQDLFHEILTLREGKWKGVDLATSWYANDTPTLPNFFTQYAVDIEELKTQQEILTSIGDVSNKNMRAALDGMPLVLGEEQSGWAMELLDMWARRQPWAGNYLDGTYFQFPTQTEFYELIKGAMPTAEEYLNGDDNVYLDRIDPNKKVIVNGKEQDLSKVVAYNYKARPTFSMRKTLQTLKSFRNLVLKGASLGYADPGAIQFKNRYPKDLNNNIIDLYEGLKASYDKSFQQHAVGYGGWGKGTGQSTMASHLYSDPVESYSLGNINLDDIHRNFLEVQGDNSNYRVSAGGPAEKLPSSSSFMQTIAMEFFGSRDALKSMPVKELLKLQDRPWANYAFQNIAANNALWTAVHIQPNMEWQKKHKEWFESLPKESTSAEFLNLLARGEGFTIYQKADVTNHIMKKNAKFTKTDLLIRQKGAYSISAYDKHAGSVILKEKNGNMFATYQLKGYEVQVDGDGKRQLVQKITDQTTLFLGPTNGTNSDDARDYYTQLLSGLDAYNRQVSVLAREIKSGKTQMPQSFYALSDVRETINQTQYEQFQPIDVEARTNEILQNSPPSISP